MNSTQKFIEENKQTLWVAHRDGLEDFVSVSALEGKLIVDAELIEALKNTKKSAEYGVIRETGSKSVAAYAAVLAYDNVLNLLNSTEGLSDE